MLYAEERLLLYVNYKLTKKFLLSMINQFCSTSRRFATSNVNSEKDHYKTLGIQRDATAKEIKAAFYELSKVCIKKNHT